MDYDSDIVEWSERQADALRRRAHNEIDWDNVAEEIESVGRSELHAVESLIGQALRHLLKAQAWPLHRDAPSWRADSVDFRHQASDRFTGSMRQKIDVNRLYQRALRTIPETLDGEKPGPVDETCPMTLDKLLEA